MYLFLVTQSPQQLRRLYRRLFGRIVRMSGCSSWDYPTLYACYPAYARTLNTIRQAYRDRYPKESPIHLF